MAVIVAERTPSSIRAISPKWSPGPEPGALGAADRDGRLAGLDQEERRAAGALLNRLARREPPLLEQERDLRRARSRPGRRTAGRAAAPRPARRPSAGRPPSSPRGTAAGRAGRPRSPIRCRGRGRRPRSQSVASRFSSASCSSSRQSCSTSSGGTSSSTVPAVREAADRDPLQPGAPLEHLAVAGDAEAVGDHEAGDDRLAEPPARLDHPLVGPGDRVAGEHHAGGLRVEQRLDDDGDARPREEPDALAVGDRRVGVRRPPDLAERRGDLVRRRAR